jgi:hypothetical protein
MAPLITALVETVADTARRRAAASPGGRLYPPLGLVIDEAGQIAPLPSLPNLLADGGQGIVTFAILQSLAQEAGRWGEHGATPTGCPPGNEVSSAYVYTCVRRERAYPATAGHPPPPWRRHRTPHR